MAGFSFACDAENADIQRIKQGRFRYFSYSIKQDSKMRDRFEQQMTLGTILIGETKITTRKRSGKLPELSTKTPQHEKVKLHHRKHNILLIFLSIALQGQAPGQELGKFRL